MNLRILRQTRRWIAIDKPAGIHVHPPEDSAFRIRRDQNAMALVRDQIGTHIYPVHRLDRATSGVLLFALDPEAARELAGQFQKRTVRKTYYALARGWLDDELLIDRPLEIEQEAKTRVTPIVRCELPFSIRSEFQTTRVSLLQCEPLTGRYHQIRRHLSGISHPIANDSQHGDTRFNRAFSRNTGLYSLLLRATELTFQDPDTQSFETIRCGWRSHWHRLFDQLGACPRTRL